MIAKNADNSKNKRIRTLYISHEHITGGAETFLENLIKNNSQVDALVFSSSSSFFKRLRLKGIRARLSKNFKSIHREKMGWPLRLIKNFTCSFWEITGFVKSHNVDIIHANGMAAAVYAVLPALFCRKPFLWTCHDIFLPVNNRIGAVINFLTGNTVVVSNISKEIFKSRKPTLIHYGIDLRRFNPAVHRPGFIRSRYSIAAQKIAIGIAATLKKIKGFHIALEAVSILKNGGFGDRFVCFFIGGGIDGEKDYKIWLETEIKRRGLRDNIIMTGHIEDMHKVYLDLDIIVNCSIIRESFGLTAAEAMAMKKIVVASDIGGLRELIDDGVDGFLVPPGDCGSLALKLKELIENFSSFDNIRENACRKVSGNFSVEKMVSGYNSLYREIKNGGYKRI